MVHGSRFTNQRRGINVIEIMNIFIYLSVTISIIATLICAIVIYRRNKTSRIHQSFVLFLLGLAGFVFFYTFLQDPSLKEFSYFLQILSISFGVLGLCLFYYALDHEGNLSWKVSILFLLILLISPAFILLLHPYTFLEESYGFELVVDPWFMIFLTALYSILVFYTVFGLTRMYRKTENQSLKLKLQLTFSGLLLMAVAAIVFFAVIPAIFSIHYLKPIGYGLLTIGVIILTYSFK